MIEESIEVMNGLTLSRYMYVSDRSYIAANGDRMKMVYATRTGTVACFPSETIKLVQANNLSSIPRAEIEQLKSIEAIVDDEQDERKAVLDRQSTSASYRDQRQFVLLPTSYCNMGCTYCGQEHVPGRLPADHRAAVEHRVVNGIKDPETTRVRIGWFGAEPMVGYPAIKYLAPKFIEAAKENNVEYDSDMVTNGSLLDQEKLDALHHTYSVRHFEITLDGPARIHNAHRPLKNGKKSFEHIVSLMQKALFEGDYPNVSFGIRTNIDINNIAWVDEFIDRMSDFGFADDRVQFTLAPVYSWGNDVTDIEIERAEFGRLQAQWQARMIERGLSVSLMPSESAGTICPAVTLSGEVISSTGAVFSCTEFPLVAEHEKSGGLGRVENLQIGVRPAGPYDDWHQSVGEGRTPCHHCKMLPVCGGNCPKQWREGRAACPPYKGSVQERFDIIARMNSLAISPV